MHNAKITHLFHSGYAVETAEHFLIFDYYQPIPGKNDGITKGIITGDYLKTKKNILVFASHNHGDHFDPIILDWAKDNPAITYILSSDILVNTKQLNCHVMSAYEEINVGQVTIKAFGSTDQGISFLLQVDGLSIFHAGDLNWWHWSGESLKEQASAKLNFEAEMEKIIAQAIKIDIAFFPIDRRMEEFYSIGAEYFADKIKPKLLVPMHFGTDFAATQAFAKKAKNLLINTVEISHNGQEIFF
ncbi:MAG: hypothetical protein H6Q68_2495 [Firmicutes bacterium]|nr:hypothetical protein [Bacillota bacterium]